MKRKRNPLVLLHITERCGEYEFGSRAVIRDTAANRRRLLKSWRGDASEAEPYDGGFLLCSGEIHISIDGCHEITPAQAAVLDATEAVCRF